MDAGTQPKREQTPETERQAAHSTTGAVGEAPDSGPQRSADAAGCTGCTPVTGGDDSGPTPPQEPDSGAQEGGVDGGSTEPAEDCFAVFGAGQAGATPRDLYIGGSDLDAWDGEVVRVVVDSDGWGADFTGDPACGTCGDHYALAEGTIRAGSFAFHMPETIESDYTAIGIYIDTTRDHRCGEGEPRWSSNVGVLPAADVRLEISGADPMWLPEASCNINGMFDLGLRLNCR